MQLREELLDTRRKKLGYDHPDTLAILSNLAISYNEAGRHEEALKLHEENLKLRIQKYGPEDLRTLLAAHYLAESYAAIDRHAEALKIR